MTSTLTGNQAILDQSLSVSLAATTVLPTVDGWQRAVDLQPGVQVFAVDGDPVEILQVDRLPPEPVLRVNFDDYTFVDTGANQAWTVSIDRSGPATTLTTEQMQALHANPTRTVIRVPVTQALQPPQRELALSPYVLGVWLADGNRHSGAISKPDEELFELITDEGYDVQPTKDMTRTVYGLRTQLREAGLLRNKHVPLDYPWASKPQRLALLRGLMDGDGSWNKCRRQACFTTTDLGLASAVELLVTSLGWKPRVWPVLRHGFGLTVWAFDVTFTPYTDVPFSLSRKANLVDHDGFARSRRRIVDSVDELSDGRVVQVTTAGPSGLVAGRAMIPLGAQVHAAAQPRLASM